MDGWLEDTRVLWRGINDRGEEEERTQPSIWKSNTARQIWSLMFMHSWTVCCKMYVWWHARHKMHPGSVSVWSFSMENLILKISIKLRHYVVVYQFKTYNEMPVKKLCVSFHSPTVTCTVYSMLYNHYHLHLALCGQRKNHIDTLLASLCLQ